jgi:DNA-binding transcriptional ArsR family regulator
MDKSQKYYELHAEVCKTFGHAKRLMIIDSLRKKEMSVTELAKTIDMDISNLSQHLTILKEKGMVRIHENRTIIEGK